MALGARFGFGSKGLAIQGVNDAQAVAPGGFVTNPTPFSFVLYASTVQRPPRHRRSGGRLHRRRNGPLQRGVAVRSAPLRLSPAPVRLRRRFRISAQRRPSLVHPRRCRRLHRSGAQEFPAVREPRRRRGAERAKSRSIPTTPTAFLSPPTPAITLTDEEEVHRNSIYTVGGVDRWGDVVLDYHAAYSRATFHVEPQHRRRVRRTDDSRSPTTTSPTPNFPIFTFPGGTNLNDPSLYTLNSRVRQRPGIRHRRGVFLRRQPDDPGPLVRRRPDQDRRRGAAARQDRHRDRRKLHPCRRCHWPDSPVRP